MKLSIKDFFGKCHQIRSFLRILSHLLKKSLMENFIFCAVYLIGENFVGENYLSRGKYFVSFRRQTLFPDIFSLTIY